MPPIVTVPDRAAPVFAVTEIDTDPPPDTLVGDTVIQVRLSLTDQLQSLRPVTDTLLAPAALVRLTDVGDTLVGEEGHGSGSGGSVDAAACETENVAPPADNVPDRAAPVFAAAV